MSFIAPFARRRSINSQGSSPSGASVGQTTEDCGYGEISSNHRVGSNASSSSSDWPDDMDGSDKESLQSWAKEQQEKEAEEEEDLFATKEEQHIRRWFLLITLAAMIVGACVCTFTYFYLKGEEGEHFEASFQSTAQAIIDSSEFRMKVLERALLSRAQQLTTFAVFTASLWPFVSLPDFYTQGRNFLIETETQMVAWAPIITSDRNLIAWESYSTFMLESSGWFPPTEVEERLKKQLEEQSKGRSSESGEEQLSNTESGLNVPLWQLSPWIYNAWINHNLTEQFEESIQLLLRSKRPVWTRYMDISNPPQTNDNQNSTQNNSSEYATTAAPTTEGDSTVASFLFQPVFRSLRNHDVSYDDITNITEDYDEVVGIYMAAVQWDKFLDGLIPEGTSGVDLVLQNPWGQTLTYQVDKDVEGATSISLLVGTGDQHATEYDDMSETTNLTTRAVGELPAETPTLASAAVGSSIKSTVSSGTATQEEAKASGVTIPGDTDNIATRQAAPAAHDSAGSGHFQMTIYPTADFEDAYTSDEPAIYTAIMAAIVFIGIAVFFLYSRFVHNRQQKLVETANRTALVVKSLFPSNVRDRIMQQAEESENKSQARRRKKQQQLDGSNSGGISVGSAGSRLSSGGRKARRPSINLYALSTLSSGHRRSSKPSSDDRSEGDRSRSELGLGASSSQHNVGSENPYGSKPIADHFSATTVLFADMVGFTAWSSVREPTSVFTLLETIYHAFDKVARKRGIFKVETIGDCYVAVCGLPVPRPDHAIAMSYFANDCLRKMNILKTKLEVSLGPDTADLSMRIGLHSGPVTAGVLRGEKSRFQLFGDTVNTAARMESNGMKDCIHVSEETANLLVDAGKQRWLTQREEKIHAKGKGEMQTYWLTVRSMNSYIAARREGERRPSGDSAITSSSDLDIDDGSTIGSNSEIGASMPSWASRDSEQDEQAGFPQALVLGDRVQRLVDWNVDQLVNLLKKIVANRKGKGRLEGDADRDQSKPAGAEFDLRTDSSIMQEVTEVITFPKPTIAGLLVGETSNQTGGEVDLDPEAVSQLHAFMTTVASLYNDNPFHNYAHASHVAMALITWMSRITPPAPDVANENMYEAQLSGDWKRRSDPSKELFSLQSDPLTHFALIFSALIHDLEHAGVPNSQLVKEKAQLATLYKDKSIHEQASIDTAFETLMDDKYSQLRSVLFATEDEFYRFRQIVINSVMGTDILDKKVMAKQSVRWGCLFRDHESESEDPYGSDNDPEDESDQKTSIVVERLLLISDIAHTTQHWYVYRKWNEKLFEESYLAFKAGRAEDDPALTWYEDELLFFDTYVIPLVLKMKDCELFDSSCDEYVRYAKSNREQWRNTGKEEVASMAERFKELEFEVKDNYNPIPDGRIFSPSNASLSPSSSRESRDWKSVLEKFHDK